MGTFSYHVFLNLRFFIFFISMLPYARAVNFKMTRFDPDENKILYQGDAAPSVGAIELNYKSAYTCRVGWATYAERVQLWDSDSGKLSNFTTQFSFTIDTDGQNPYGSGLGYFMAPVGFQIPPNSGGGFLGLFNTTTAYSSSNQIVLVEFDTYNNPEWDPSDVKDHVGINNNSISSAVYTGWNASSHSGHTVDVRISYNANTKNLSVSWSYRESSNTEENTSLFYVIDLKKVLPQWVTVGFSAATSQYLERHILESWEFNSSFDTNETNQTNAKKRKTMFYVRIFAPLFAGIVIIVAAVAAVILWWKWKIQTGENEETTGLTSANNDSESQFTRRDLAFATNNFSDYTKLDEEGLGVVHRGYLIDFDTFIAVKKISMGSKQEKEPIAELKIISQLKHENLLQLMGWCHDGGEILLVYELMQNGSLDAHLFGKECLLTWAMRYKISLGLASALLFLHEKWDQCSLLHKDIKSSNILLNSNFKVKLDIFGLAGTSGYLSSENISTDNASEESHVFSFGVIALEIATGRKSTDVIEQNSEMSLVKLVWDLYGRGELLLGVDERLDHQYIDEKQVERLMTVGLWCAHPDSSSRPSIKEAIQVLKSEIEMPNLPKEIPDHMHDAPQRLESHGEYFLTARIEGR